MIQDVDGESQFQNEQCTTQRMVHRSISTTYLNAIDTTEDCDTE